MIIKKWRQLSLIWVLLVALSSTSCYRIFTEDGGSSSDDNIASIKFPNPPDESEEEISEELTVPVPVVLAFSITEESRVKHIDNSKGNIAFNIDFTDDENVQHQWVFTGNVNDSSQNSQGRLRSRRTALNHFSKAQPNTRTLPQHEGQWRAVKEGNTLTQFEILDASGTPISNIKVENLTLTLQEYSQITGNVVVTF